MSGSGSTITCRSIFRAVVIPLRMLFRTVYISAGKRTAYFPVKNPVYGVFKGLEMKIYAILFFKLDIGSVESVCVSLVCVLSSHIFWTSGLWTHQPGSHKRKVTNFYAFLPRCLP